MEEQGIRLNKYLSEAGVCSRRKAEEYIEAGWVQVNGAPAKQGVRVAEGDCVTVKGMTVVRRTEKEILAFYKPAGLVCSARGQGAPTVQDYLKYPTMLYYVGRLDKDSEGLLLLTNDGALANAVCRARYGHEKEYEVAVSRPVTEAFLQKMARGVPILDTVTRPCKVWRTGERSFGIILTQGLNRQIRRMCRACGNEVRRLKRVRIMNITLNGLEPGDYRRLTPEEEETLRRQARQSLGVEKDERESRRRPADRNPRKGDSG